jgi:hypothetical protein
LFPCSFRSLAASREIAIINALSFPLPLSVIWKSVSVS